MPEVELYPGVVSNPQVLGGKPVIKGTRVPVALILGKLAGGMSMDEVLREYHLTVDGVHAALAYAAELVADEAVYVTRK